MNQRTKAVDISAKTRRLLYERDNNACIFCKSGVGQLTAAHIIPRSAGGLGVLPNLVTACSKCHYELDHTSKREIMLAYANKYLNRLYSLEEREKTRYEKQCND